MQAEIQTAVYSQAPVVDDLDNRSDSFLIQFRGGGPGQRTVPEKQGAILAFRDLSRFTDGKRSHSDGDIDRGRVAGGSHGVESRLGLYSVGVKVGSEKQRGEGGYPRTLRRPYTVGEVEGRVGEVITMVEESPGRSPLKKNVEWILSPETVSLLSWPTSRLAGASKPPG